MKVSENINKTEMNKILIKISIRVNSKKVIMMLMIKIESKINHNHNLNNNLNILLLKNHQEKIFMLKVIITLLLQYKAKIMIRS